MTEDFESDHMILICLSVYFKPILVKNSYYIHICEVLNNIKIRMVKDE